MKHALWFLILLFLRIPARTIEISPAKAQSPVQTQSPRITQDFAKEPISPEAVRDFVSKQAEIYGVNPADALWIVSHESQDGRNMRGDDGQSRGYWMISSRYHPEVSDACADDLTCSTNWSLKQIRNGKIDEWSTWRLRCKWYLDAPDCHE